MICTRALSIISKRDVLSKRLRFVSTFNAQRKALQRNRAAKLDNHEQFDYLRNGIAEILAGELNDAFFYSIAAIMGTASLAYFNQQSVEVKVNCLRDLFLFTSFLRLQG